MSDEPFDSDAALLEMREYWARLEARKPLTEQYPQRNRAERRRAVKLARKDAVAIGENQS